MIKLLCNNKEWAILYADDDMLAVTIDGVTEATSMDYFSNKVISILSKFLPAEGIGSKRDFALYVAKTVKNLVVCDYNIDKCLNTVHQRVYYQYSVSDNQLGSERDYLNGLANSVFVFRRMTNSYHMLMCALIATMTDVDCPSAFAHADAAIIYKECYGGVIKQIHRKLLEILDYPTR